MRDPDSGTLLPASTGRTVNLRSATSSVPRATAGVLGPAISRGRKALGTHPCFAVDAEFRCSADTYARPAELPVAQANRADRDGVVTPGATDLREEAAHSVLLVFYRNDFGGDDRRDRSDRRRRFDVDAVRGLKVEIDAQQRRYAARELKPMAIRQDDPERSSASGFPSASVRPRISVSHARTVSVSSATTGSDSLTGDARGRHSIDSLMVTFLIAYGQSIARTARGRPRLMLGRRGGRAPFVFIQEQEKIHGLSLYSFCNMSECMACRRLGIGICRQ